MTKKTDLLCSEYVHWLPTLAVPSPWLRNDQTLTVLSRLPVMKEFSPSSACRHLIPAECPANPCSLICFRLKVSLSARPISCSQYASQFPFRCRENPPDEEDKEVVSLAMRLWSSSLIAAAASVPARRLPPPPALLPTFSFELLLLPLEPSVAPAAGLSAATALRQLKVTGRGGSLSSPLSCWNWRHSARTDSRFIMLPSRWARPNRL